jgi:hypothetical protein
VPKTDQCCAPLSINVFISRQTPPTLSSLTICRCRRAPFRLGGFTTSRGHENFAAVHNIVNAEWYLKSSLSRATVEAQAHGTSRRERCSASKHQTMTGALACRSATGCRNTAYIAQSVEFWSREQVASKLIGPECPCLSSYLAARKNIRRPPSTSPDDAETSPTDVGYRGSIRHR